MPSTSADELIETFLRYQHVFVFTVPVVFVAGIYLTAPLPTDAGSNYWLEFWWLFPVFVLGATIVNTVGISGSALFVPFFIFLFPLVAYPLSPETLVKVGLISESFGLSSSALAFIRYGLVDRRLAVALVGGGLPFVIGGALLSFVIPEPVFYALLGVALVASSYLLFRADLEGADHGGESVSTDGGHHGDAAAAASSSGIGDVRTAADGTVTRVDRDGNEYVYDRAGYLRRFGNYGVGGAFQGLAGFGIGELGIISMLRSSIPVRVAIGTNHIVVAVTAVVASIVHVFGGGLVGGHGIDLATTPWNMVVFTVPATVTGGQIAPYVSTALDTGTIKTFVGVLFAVIAVALFLIAGGIV